jgi:hypothetical protein
MPASNFLKSFRDGEIKLFDGTSPAVNYTVSLEAGDFSISGLSQSLKEVTTYMDRGDLSTLRLGNQTFPSGAFTAHLADISDASDQTMIDFLMKSGSFSGNLSTLTGEVYCVKIQLTIEGTDHGDSADHQIVLDDCHCTVDVSEGDPNSVSVSFTCYGAISMV